MKNQEKQIPEGYVGTKEMIQMFLNAIFDNLPEDREEVEAMRDFTGIMLGILKSIDEASEEQMSVAA
jgi:hypothetical protein